MVIILCASRRKLVNVCRRDSVLQELAHVSGGENQRRAAKFHHGLGAVGVGVLRFFWEGQSCCRQALGAVFCSFGILWYLAQTLSKAIQFFGSKPFRDPRLKRHEIPSLLKVTR